MKICTKSSKYFVFAVILFLCACGSSADKSTGDQSGSSPSEKVPEEVEELNFTLCVDDLGVTDNPKPTWLWNDLINADHYLVSLNGGNEQIVSESSFTPQDPLSEGEHSIDVVAIGNDGAVLGSDSASVIYVHILITALKFDGVDCALDLVTSEILYPINGQISLSPRITFEAGEDIMLKIGNAMLTNGDYYDFGVVDVGTQVNLSLIAQDGDSRDYVMTFTGLPIAQITANKIIPDTKKLGKFVLVSNKTSENTGQNFVGIEIRGGTSVGYPKQSYAIDFRDAGDLDKVKDIRLLDMRSDEDWILNAAYIDKSLMRNLVSNDIFRAMWDLPYDTDYGRSAPLGRHVEVFLNYQYNGICVLMEKIDRDLLGLKKYQGKGDSEFGVLYKATASSADFEMVDFFTGDVKDDWSVGYVLKYPIPDIDDALEYSILKEPLNDLVEFVAKSSDAEFAQGIADKIDIDNSVNYHILLLLTDAADNGGRSYYLASRKYSIHGGYDNIYMLPWDFDATYGRFWDSVPTGARVSDWDPYSNNLFRRLMDTNANDYSQLLKKRWNELRADILSLDNLVEMFEQYDAILNSSGAVERNFNRFPIGERYYDNGSHSDEMDYITEYYLPSRLYALDNAIDKL